VFQPPHHHDSIKESVGIGTLLKINVIETSFPYDKEGNPIAAIFIAAIIAFIEK
jgi:hypothetical protein